MSETNQHRRKLLKVGAGVPVVLTVQPGTSVAASTSTCATPANVGTGSVNNLFDAGDTQDGWLRCAVEVYTLTLLGTTPPATRQYVIAATPPGVATSSLGVSTAESCSPVADGMYYKVDGTDTIPGAAETSGFGSLIGFPAQLEATKVGDLSGPGITHTRSSKVQTTGLVRINNTTKEIIGFNWTTTSGTQITASCLNSFA